MSVVEACKILEEIDVNNNLKEQTCVALCGIAGKNEQIITFNFKEYKDLKIESHPQSLIICGKINDFEKGAIHEYRC